MVQHGRKVRMNADNSQANGRSNPVLKSESIVGAAENLPSAKTNRDGEAQRGLRILVKRVLKRLNVLTNWLEWKKNWKCHRAHQPSRRARLLALAAARVE
jgi:hypothetical protein